MNINMDTIERACTSKKKHESERKAIAAAQKYEREGKCPQRAYLCPICNYWHLN